MFVYKVFKNDSLYIYNRRHGYKVFDDTVVKFMLVIIHNVVQII